MSENPAKDEVSPGEEEEAFEDVDELVDEGDDDEDLYPGDDGPDGPGLEKAPPLSVSEQHLKGVIESLLFVSDKPLTVRRIANVTRASGKDVRRHLDALVEDYQERGLRLEQVGGGYSFRSAAANAPFVRELIKKRPVRLSRAQLETLAIAAYRQPLTRPELEEIRGVDSGSALKTLLERGLIKILGRKEEPGRPLIYGTSPQFLTFFGLKSLKELPTLKEFTELSDESKTLFARRTGESIESIGDIIIDPLSDEDEDASLPGALTGIEDEEEGGIEERVLDLPEGELSDEEE